MHTVVITLTCLVVIVEILVLVYLVYNDSKK